MTPPVTRLTVRRAYSIAHKYFAPGLDIDDLAQEALVGALQARRGGYQQGHGTSFSSFEYDVMERRVRDAVSHARRLKRYGGRHDAPLSETLAAAGTTQELVEARTELRGMLARLTDLTPIERRAVVGFALGLTYKELGPRRRIDNALQRARRKLTA